MKNPSSFEPNTSIPLETMSANVCSPSSRSIAYFIEEPSASDNTAAGAYTLPESAVIASNSACVSATV